jgi:AcrR family transcriptional regulator
MGTSAPATESLTSPEKISTRQKILNAALQIVEEQGIGALTQPRVAKQAGVRQSNLTYYFPHKSDLLMGVLEASHQKADGHSEHPSTNNFRDIAPFLQGLMFDPKRARFFFSVLLEVSDNPELRPTIAAHAQGFTAFLAPFFRRMPDDPLVQHFVDLLRGMALRKLMEPKMPQPDLVKLAENFGLL